MSYGTLNSDIVQSSTAGTPPLFYDGSGSQIGTLCRAWVNFVGSTGAVNASFNVSSVTYIATGNFTINFTNALPDTNYVAVGSNDGLGGGSNYVTGFGSSFSGGFYSTTKCSGAVVSNNGGGTVCNTVRVAVFR